MDTKANLANRKKINELALQHNKLTTLVGCLLNEISFLKKEVNDLRSGGSSEPLTQQPSHISSKRDGQKYPNFTDLRAEDILKQLSINTVDN
jgi:hypothetical protein